MHIEDRLDGPIISEYSDYMIGAQDDGMIKRWNPSYAQCRVEIGPIEARNLLNRYSQSFAGEITWLRDVVNNLSH